MTTEKQREANQQNAQQSTGPKTEGGKTIAKLNALKHGVLSDATVITRGTQKERKEVYQRLSHDLREYFRPHGAMEEILVEQIVVCLWRKRRLLRYEVGCIRKNLETPAPQQTEDADDDSPPQTPTENMVRLEQRVAQHREAMALLQDGCDILSNEAAVGWENTYGWVAERLEVAPPEGSDSYGTGIRDALIAQGFSEAQIRQELLQVEQAQLAATEGELPKLKAQAALDAEHNALLGMLPELHKLDQLIRYDAAIDKQLHKAIHQLKFLQESRQGKPVQPPLNVGEA